MKRRLMLISLVLLGGLAGSAVGSVIRGPDEAPPQLDLGRFAREIERGPAQVARGRYRGSSCAAFARQFGRRVDAAFLAVRHRDPDRHGGRVWSAQVGELNLLSRELTARGLMCEPDRFVRVVDAVLSETFRRDAHRFVPALYKARSARDHSEWRALVMAMLQAAPRTRA